MRKSDFADVRAVVDAGQPRPILLLGAGASVTSGVPLVRELVDLIGRHAFCLRHQRDVADPTLVRSDWIPWLQSHEWYDADVTPDEQYTRHITNLLVPRERRRQFFQQHVMVSPDNASRGYRALASLVGKRRIHSVLTTNFDSLVIDSCRRDPTATAASHVRTPEEAHLITTDPAVSQVVHVHGAVEHYTDLNLADEVEHLNGALVQHLVALVADHPLIVVGYRGAERSVMHDLLHAALERSRIGLPHGVFWCARSRDGGVHENVQEFAAACGSNFALIEIDGFDELLCDLDADATRLASSVVSPPVRFDAQPTARRLEDPGTFDSDLVADVLDRSALERLALVDRTGLDRTPSDLLRIAGLTHVVDNEEVLTAAADLLFSPAKPVGAIIEVDGHEHSLSGNLFELHRALTEMIAATNEPYRVKGPESVEVRPYPPLAMKELLVNALAHRDYESSEPIRLSIDALRIRVENPGGLLDPSDIDDLGDRPIRHYRNASIAEVFYAAGLMDKYGSGLVDVRRWATDGGAVATFDTGDTNTTFTAVLTSRPDSAGRPTTVDPGSAYEVFYVNALPVELPKAIWVGPTWAKRPLDIFKRHERETLPRFVFDGGNLLTFSDLSDRSNPLRRDVDAPEQMDVAELCDTAAGQAKVIELLNRSFERHMERRGVQVRHDKQRLWFDADGEHDRVITYPARMRTATRTVTRARGVESKRPYYEHQSAEWSFINVDGEWLLAISPSWVFTRDGRRGWESRRRNTKLATKKMSNERNQSVLNHLFFWSWAICGPEEGVVLDDGTGVICISKAPLTRHRAGGLVTLGSGIDDDPDPDDSEALDEDGLGEFDEPAYDEDEFE